MTREEAITKIGYIIDCIELGIYCGEDEEVFEALDIALTALRRAGREQVEQVWRGCEWCNGEQDDAFEPGGAHDFRVLGDAIYYYDSNYGWEGEQILFCPFCGKALTDEAVQMVMERLEALKDGKGD